MDVDDIENKIQILTLDSIPRVSSSVSGNSEYLYNLLDGCSECDRDKLQQERLKHVLKQLQSEREDTSFSRSCLFCRKHFSGNRSVLLSHLVEQHNFLIGAPDNIVFINEFLDHLEWMLKELRCFYCNGVFKDWMTLKEHMRKKQHKRVNPQDKTYDRFYVVNYLEAGRTWQDLAGEGDGSPDDSEMELADDGNEVFVCLFCDSKFTVLESVWDHMTESHKFDYCALKDSNHLSFYLQIKLINFIRRKTHEKRCFFCDLKFNFQTDLMRHLVESGHTLSLPERCHWDQPQFFFPTFENDNLLCALEDEELDCRDCVVYPEENKLSAHSVNFL